MSDIAIRAEGISKLYRIGTRRDRHDTLRDHLVHGVTDALRRALRALPLGSGNGRHDSASQDGADAGSSPAGPDTGQTAAIDHIWALKTSHPRPSRERGRLSVSHGGGLFFFGGLQLMTIGVVGEYLGRMFDETKRRPLYFLNDYKPSEAMHKQSRAVGKEA